MTAKRVDDARQDERDGSASNLSQFLFPNYGSHYAPLIPGLILTLAAVIVTLVWGSETLAR